MAVKQSTKPTLKSRTVVGRGKLHHKSHASVWFQTNVSFHSFQHILGLPPGFMTPLNLTSLKARSVVIWPCVSPTGPPGTPEGAVKNKWSADSKGKSKTSKVFALAG